MKVAFLIEYFPPYATGGSEWSTFYLAQPLYKEKIEIVVITPNYGQKKLEDKVNFEIKKFPFYKKIKSSRLPGNLFYTNPLWIMWTAVYFFLILKKEKVDAIHVQGKYSLPGARIANLFLKKPLVFTARDYQPICNYGFCLYHKYKGCNLWQYFFLDFRTYYKDYVSAKSPIKFTLNILFAIWGRIAKNILAISAKGLKIVVLSNYQKEIYRANGFKNITVIGNSIIPPEGSSSNKKNRLVFVGRLTPGKGVQILISLIPQILAKYPTYQFFMIGDGFLKEKLLVMSKKFNKLKILGQLDHNQTIKAIKESKLAIIPSVWPEPFGRIVAESLMSSTPVVVTKSGALPELVSKRWGVVAETTPAAVLSAITKVLSKNKVYQNNIEKDHTELVNRFTTSVPKKYLSLYREIIK